MTLYVHKTKTGKFYGESIIDQFDKGSLLPCPFCGRASTLRIDNTTAAQYSVKCLCGAEKTGRNFGIEFATEDICHDAHSRALYSAHKGWNEREEQA
jgi:hypothetical protein